MTIKISWVFILILLLNIISNALGTLKHILIVKVGGWLTPIVVTIDAAVYAVILKSFSSNGASAITAYILGHLLGYLLGTFINKKLALGISDIQIYVKDYQTMMKIQQRLIEEGFSSTCEIGIIDETTSRYSLNIQANKKDLKKIKRIFADNGIKHPTMLIREIESVSGKIAERI